MVDRPAGGAEPDGLERQIAELTAEVRELRAQSAALAKDLARLRAEGYETEEAARHEHAETVARLERLMEAVRVTRDDDARTVRLLAQARTTAQYAAAFDEDEPLVSVTIATYRNFEALRDRALPSVLSQTYTNWEVVIVGDAAPDETATVVEELGDARVRFVNRPFRGPYPPDPSDAWYISGTQPFNLAVELAGGHWIAPLADDDTFTPDHIEVLLGAARSARAEVAIGDLARHAADGSVTRLGSWPPARGGWGLQGTLYHAALRIVPVLESDWVFHVPNDWSVCERWLRAGVRFARVDAIVGEYFPSWDFGGRAERQTTGDF